MDKLKILFLCTGNSCRSQMAEGFAKYLYADVIDAYSAGTEIHGLNQNAVKVMLEAGVDISKNVSKNVKELMHINFDFVITVCDNANETCPVFLGKTKIIHKGFDDPPKLALKFENFEDKLNCYRKVRDEIQSYILELKNELFHI